MPTIECRCFCGSNYVSAGDTEVTVGTKCPERRRSTRVWVSSRDQFVRKTVGLEVELKLNLPSSCAETNQAAGLPIGGAGGGLPGCGGGETIDIFALFFHTQLATPGLPKKVLTAIEWPPWESVSFL